VPNGAHSLPFSGATIPNHSACSVLKDRP